jgi:hypothetical protein
MHRVEGTQRGVAFMSEDRRCSNLTSFDLPDPDAGLMEIADFALTFDGYGYAESRCPDKDPTSAAGRLYREVCEALDADGGAAADLTLDDLRCALFYHQRMVRWNEPDVMLLGMDASKHAEDL